MKHVNVPALGLTVTTAPADILSAMRPGDVERADRASARRRQELRRSNAAVPHRNHKRCTNRSAVKTALRMEYTR